MKFKIGDKVLLTHYPLADDSYKRAHLLNSSFNYVYLSTLPLTTIFTIDEINNKDVSLSLPNHINRRCSWVSFKLISHLPIKPFQYKGDTC